MTERKSYRQLLSEGTKQLDAAGAEEARADAERLLMDLLGVSRSFLFLHGNDPAEPETAARFQESLQRRLQGEPVQYIAGMQEFMGLPFRVDPSVLIPRQDTETLVESALELAAGMPEGLRILDMCCGSGAIAVSMACHLPGCRVTACDLSEKALETASSNASLNQVNGRIRFLRTDMFQGAQPGESGLQGEMYDMILCNPPYIPTDVIGTLDVKVKEYEPLTALDGGPDGLRFYRILAAEAWQYLAEGGRMLMEIGHDQRDEVRNLLEETGHYAEIDCLQDLAGKDRVVRCRLAQTGV